MRIIQSSWSCNQPDLLTSNSGWLAPEYNLMAWTLSCLQLKQYYSDVVLYCDSVSAKTLIDTLQLPYSEVVCNLDVLNGYHPQLWALPKIHAYSQQDKPFLHVDGDVFIWKKFEDDLMKSALIAQNIESATEYYGKIMQSLELELSYFPKEIIKERQAKSPILAYNAGIFGGTDVSFFKEYTAKAFEFVDKNSHNLSKINVSNFNVFFEQYLFYCLAKEKQQNVSVLISEVIGDNQYKGFGDFAKVPFEKQYLHLLGQYKRSDFICIQMANRLRQDYPDYYYRIIELFKKRKVPLLKDYYLFDNCSQNDLVSRHDELKNRYTTNSITKEINSIGQLRFSKFITTDCLIDKNKKKALDKEQLKDLEFFCHNINLIMGSKFSLIAIDFLYARDLNVNQYFQYLFEDIKNIYSKKIIADDTIEIIESYYDWPSFFEKKDSKGLDINTSPVKKPSKASTVIVPECERGGFTIESIDDLDLILLKILEETKMVQELLDELREYFDEIELNKSKVEFEKLIFGRIKQGVHMKSIRVVY
jgi:hypothetical protein